MTRKVLVLQGSPRRKGNTSRLASAFERGAREAGCEVVRFDVAHMDGTRDIEGNDALEAAYALGKSLGQPR